MVKAGTNATQPNTLKHTDIRILNTRELEQNTESRATVIQQRHSYYRYNQELADSWPSQ
jgi:hypothetical protein